MSSYVFLTQCSDFSEAQVVKSFLDSQGFHPKVRDEQMRTMAPHFEQLLGKLIIEVPEFEFMAASQALESLEHSPELHIVKNPDQEAKEQALHESQDLAKKCLTNAVLGCIFLPVLCNLYSLLLGLRVLKKEFPLSAVSRNRLILAMGFNSLGFYLWLVFGFKYFLRNM